MRIIPQSIRHNRLILVIIYSILINSDYRARCDKSTFIAQGLDKALVILVAVVFFDVDVDLGFFVFCHGFLV